MTEQLAVARNQRAIRALAATLERWGLSDPYQRAELLAMNLLADGLAPVEKPPLLRGPQSTPAARAEALAATRAAVDHAKRRHSAKESADHPRAEEASA